MKKCFFVLMLLLFGFAESLLAQSPSSLGPQGAFDQVHDRFGNTYSIDNLQINGHKPLGGPYNVTTLPTNSCSAGYFTLWFAQGSICDLNPTAKNLMCELYTNISGFIPSNAAANGISVNILCADYTGTANVGAVATPFYVFPNSPNNPYPGILQNQAQKAIINGIDPYLNISTSFYNPGASFYHGAVYTNSAAPWSYVMGTSTISPSDLDFYTVHLHEAMHILGIMSLIHKDGFSTFGQANNYFGVYDQFLVDQNGTHLIASTTPTACPNSNVAFTPSLITSLASATTGCLTDASNCSTAIQYSSSAVTLTLYTPNCFEDGSSLSHFEDQCTTNTISVACFTANGNSNNNMYHVMANFIDVGNCYVKRFLKPEERLVLCDLGYSVADSYTSAVVIDGASTTHSYSGGPCSPSSYIWGVNDGMFNGAYTYTTTSNSYVLSFVNDILANDISSGGISAQCIELVYNNGGLTTLTLGVSDFTVNTQPAVGLVIVKYIPLNTTTGQFGNATYVYIYFLPSACNPPSMCTLVQNPSFDYGNGCGVMQSVGTPKLDCWNPFYGYCHRYMNGCTTSGNVFNLGVNTVGTPAGTPLNAPNGNNSSPVAALVWPEHITDDFPGIIKNNLNPSLVPTHTYQLSFYAVNYLDAVKGNTSTVVITIATNSVYFAQISGSSYPSGLDVLTSFTINPSTNWSMYTYTFVFTPTVSANTLFVGIDRNKTLTYPGCTFNPNLSLSNFGQGIYCFMDDINITEFIPAFSIPSPTICSLQSITDLAQYISPSTPGQFTGQYVAFSNPNYDFNLNTFGSPGTYPIGFTFSNTVANCKGTVYQLVSIGSNTNYVALNSVSLCISNPTINLYSLLTNTNTPGITFTLNGSPVASSLFTQYTFTTGGTYTLASSNTATNVCSNSIYTAMIVVSNPTVPYVSYVNSSVAITNTTICTGDQFDYLTYTNAKYVDWQPGGTNVAGSLSPTISTTYTITAFDFTSCAVTSTFAVIVSTNCCTQTLTLPSFTATSISAPTTLLSQVVMNSFTIQPNQKLLLTGDEFVFAPNVKVTVASGATLEIVDSHLYACSNDMWEGIEVLDGGYLQSIHENKDNLIEDAVTAIDVKAKTTSALALKVANTTFNRNYIDISIGTYSGTSAGYPYSINSCVFTCRHLSVTSTSWPQTGTTISSATFSADLRHAFVGTPTTGLVPPYLNHTFAIANLKQPYATQPSHIAIKLNNVGIATTTNIYGITIGENSFASSFNLFDAHGQFISSVNSNVTSLNNVFQNTQTYTTVASNFGGAAISHSTSGTLNTMLSLTASSKNVGNRFWNCHKGIEGKNTYLMNVSNAIFRSDQNTANPAFAPKGLEINTNRFEYVIQENEFSNLEKGINIPLAAGVFSLPPGYTLPPGVYVVPGVYADRMLITQNEFNGNTGGGTYMNDAINVSAVNSTPLFPVTSTSLDPVSNALSIVANIITEVHRGINVSGLYSFPIKIASNQIVLKDNASVQHAVKLTNNNPTIAGIGGFGYGKSIVAQNTASFSSTSFSSSPNNSVTALVHCGHNGYAFLSPSVTCNSLAQGPQGFVFEGSNKGAIWAGNDMQPMLRGMVLSNNGNIGQQGSSSTASANMWDGTWAGTNYGTYMNGSTALSSILYVGGNTGEFPANNFGGNLPQNWYSPSTVLTATIGSYTCNDMANYKTISVPNNDDSFLSAELFYMEQQDFYYLLHISDSIRYSDPDFESFYDECTDLSIGVFVQAEQLLSQNDYSTARDLLSGLDIVDPNTVELNYLAFYDIYAKYLENEVLTEEDKAALSDLAMLCPGTQGACIYQARALYNTIYHEILEPACEIGGGDRRISKVSGNSLFQQSPIRIFPNPTHGKLTIETNKGNEELGVEIRDLSNRLVYKAQVKATGFFANLELNLLNGAYLIRIEQANGNVILKKLLIAK